MPYQRTAAVTSHESDATADQYNSLMAEVKAAVEGIPTHDVSVAIAYGGGSGGDLPSTITVTDNSPVGDSGFDISCVGTITYNGNDQPTKIDWVFNATELDQTVTETFTWTGDNITAIGRSFS